jgi:hypothetical protein
VPRTRSSGPATLGSELLVNLVKMLLIRLLRRIARRRR